MANLLTEKRRRQFAVTPEDEGEVAPINNLLTEKRKRVAEQKGTTSTFKKYIEEARKNPWANFALSIMEGSGKTGIDILKTLHKSGTSLNEFSEDRLKKAGITPEKYPKLFEQSKTGKPIDIEKLEMPELARAGISRTLGRFVGETLPYFVLPGGGVAKGIEKTTPLLTKLAARGAAEIPKMSAYGALTTPEAPVKGAVIGGVSAPITGLGTAGVGKVIRGITRPLETKKEFLKYAIKKYAPEQLHKHVNERVTNILNSLKGTSTSETSNKDVFDTVQRHYSELYPHRKNMAGISEDIYKNEITPENYRYIHPDESVSAQYNKATELSKQIPHTFDRTNLDKSINSSINKLNKELEIAKGAPAYRKDIQDVVDILDETKKLDISDFEGADIVKRLINQKLKERPPAKIAGALHDAQRGLRESVEETYKGNPELYKIWREADLRTSNEVKSFWESSKGVRSPFIKMYEKEGENVDNFIGHYIKPGADDLTKNFLKILPDEESVGMAGFNFLENAAGKSAYNYPEVAIKQYSKLSPYQRKNLYPKHYEELNELEKAYINNPKLFKRPTSGEPKKISLSSMFPGALGYTITQSLPVGAGVYLAGELGKKGLKKYAASPVGKALLEETIKEKQSRVGASSLKNLLSPFIAQPTRGALSSLSEFGELE